MLIFYSFQLDDLLVNILSNIIGGVIVIFLAFYINEIKFKVDISGVWVVRTLHINSNLNRYKNMELDYHLNLIQNSLEIKGSGEKISQKMVFQNIHYEYPRNERVLSKIYGSIEKNYISKSKVNLMIIEKGKFRESRTVFSLVLIEDDYLVGSFYSTAADSQGQVEMKKLFPFI